MAQKYKDNNLPLDGIWSDLDYMVDKELFTYDLNRFPVNQMKTLISNYHYVLRFDLGIKFNSYVHNMSKNIGVILKDASGN